MQVCDLSIFAGDCAPQFEVLLQDSVLITRNQISLERDDVDVLVIVQENPVVFCLKIYWDLTMKTLWDLALEILGGVQTW